MPASCDEFCGAEGQLNVSPGNKHARGDLQYSATHHKAGSQALKVEAQPSSQQQRPASQHMSKGHCRRSPPGFLANTPGLENSGAMAAQQQNVVVAAQLSEQQQRPDLQQMLSHFPPGLWRKPAPKHRATGMAAEQQDTMVAAQPSRQQQRPDKEGLLSSLPSDLRKRLALVNHAPGMAVGSAPAAAAEHANENSKVAALRQVQQQRPAGNQGGGQGGQQAQGSRYDFLTVCRSTSTSCSSDCPAPSHSHVLHTPNGAVYSPGRLVQ